MGADDYITKPVGVRELLVRVKAVLRRYESTAARLNDADEHVLKFGEALVDFGSFETKVRGETVHLSPKGYGILRLLWESRGKAVSRGEILQKVWGYDVYPTTRTVDNHVAELRAALEPEPVSPRHLLTVHAVGYRLVLSPEG